MLFATDILGKTSRRRALKNLLAAGGLTGLAYDSLFGGEANSFYQRLQPAPLSGGFAMDDYWVWCGSVVKGEDGRYHMFASRWPKTLSFVPHWVTSSEVVRASSDTPEGPCRFEEVVLPARREGFWDGKMTHNPTIHKAGDTYLLFYTGTAYAGQTPPGTEAWGSAKIKEARQNQRIGLATAKSVKGPWQRLDKPVLEPRQCRYITASNSQLVSTTTTHSKENRCR